MAALKKWISLILILSLLPSKALHADQPTWQLVTAAAPWTPRDSCGELTYKDRIWLLGGWMDSFQAPPRDVWSSADGKNWELVTEQAPWKHSDLPMTTVFQDRMWLMGGWFNGRLPGHQASAEVWSSTDGQHWQQATTDAGWSPRLAGAVVVFKDRVWVFGGTENYYFGDEKSLKNDVWSSADGIHWKLETANADWHPRAYHQALVLNDRIYVMGGGNYVPSYQAYHDVWSSADGKNWQQETAAAPWSPRLWFSVANYRNQMWVIGGWSNNPSKNWGDMWYSADGQHWREFKSTAGWKERHEHSVYLFQDKLWVVAGHAQPLSNEVWSLQLSADWTGN